MDNKKFETEEEMKDRLRKEILDELNGKTHKEKENEIQSFGKPKKASSVNFSKSENIQEKKEEVVQTNKVSEKSNNGVLIVCLIVVVVAVALFPKISSTITKTKNKQRKPSVKVEAEPEKEYEALTLESEEIQNISYPVMHIDNSIKNTYFSLDTFVVSNYSNNDLLYNALIDVGAENMKIYSGTYNGKYCGGESNKISIIDKNIKSRISNKFNNNTKYTLEDITIPTNNVNTNLVGTWKYDSANKMYVYYGDCNPKKSNLLYLDISVPYDVKSGSKNIEADVYSYVAFALVNTESKLYILYSDYNYTKELTKGMLTSNNYEKELTDIVKNMDKSNINKYKYSFSKKDCSYSEFCFVKGEWTK